MPLNYYVYADNRPAQLEWFNHSDSRFEPPAGVTYLPGLLSEHEILFQQLQSTICWQRHYSTRDTISWGESYVVGTITRPRFSWPDFLSPLARMIQQQFGFLPNNCVANRYRSGRQTIGFHSDQTMPLHHGSGVAILSLGAVRHLVFRQIDAPAIHYHYALQPGSCIVMDNATQSVWQHGILPEPDSGPRISLSFRRLTRPGSGMV